MDHEQRRTSPTAGGPRLAGETCALRLEFLAGGGPVPDVDWRVSWHGRGGFPHERPGSEATVQALSGLMAVHGRDEGAPRRLGLEVASVAAGLLATQGVLAAGIAAARGRPVPVVRTSVLEAALVLLSHYFVVATSLGDAVPGPPLAGPGPPFRSADGRWFEIETLDPGAWKEVWTRLGAGDADLGRGWTQFRWRYERAACSLPPGLHEAAARHPLARVAEACLACGVSMSPLRDYAEVLAGVAPGTGHPRLRPPAAVRAGGGPLRDAGRAGRRARPPGGEGAAFGAITLAGGNATARANAARPARGTDVGLPLAGIRVVEATSRIQGPFAGMLLRMLGAEVVRVQPPEGDYGRAALTLHRGKDAVCLDLAAASGRAALVDLVAGADVFLHNWRPGKAAEWRLAPGDLTTVNPTLVYAEASGWGDRPEGRRLVGTDFLVQASAGLGHGLNPDGEPPFPSRVILSDLFGALVGAEGVLAALYRRERSGSAWVVESSLLDGAMALQAHVLEGLHHGEEQGRRAGRPVWGVLDRPVATTDGTVVVGVDEPGAYDGLCQICDVDPTTAPRSRAEEAVAARLAAGTAAAWEAQLSSAGVPCATVPAGLADVAADPRLAALFEPGGAGGLVPRSPWSFA